MPVTLVKSSWVSGFLKFLNKATRADLFEIQTTKVVVTETLQYLDESVHASAASQTKSAAYTMKADDSGRITYIDTDAFDITLPATVVGITYTFVNAGADGAVAINISPNSSDLIEGIGFTTADDKDAINTKATAKKGDLLEIVGNGTTGWLVVRAHGTWAREG